MPNIYPYLQQVFIQEHLQIPYVNNKFQPLLGIGCYSGLRKMEDLISDKIFMIHRYPPNFFYLKEPNNRNRQTY